MNEPTVFTRLPIRLRRALSIWACLGLLMWALPASAAVTVGWLAEPAFWWVLLPCVGMAPFAAKRWPAAEKKLTPMRRRRTGTQARRRAGLAYPVARSARSALRG